MRNNQKKNQNNKYSKTEKTAKGELSITRNHNHNHGYDNCWVFRTSCGFDTTC